MAISKSSNGKPKLALPPVKANFRDVLFLTDLLHALPAGIRRPQNKDLSSVGYRLPFIRLVLASVGQDYHTTRPEKSESRHLLLTAFLFIPLLLSHNPGLI